MAYGFSHTSNNNYKIQYSDEFKSEPIMWVYREVEPTKWEFVGSMKYLGVNDRRYEIFNDAGDSLGTNEESLNAALYRLEEHLDVDSRRSRINSELE